MHFSESFLSLLISLSLIGISSTVVALVWMLIKDIKSKELW
ncbi:hypothetical protein N6H18_15205 [Reichenbachiella agarivorans]|uniref:Uncharacterized protein n=1 Tax=Reichenbachiella agarivorans TaxID=2979464 RepID=A0ABY6CMG5_9BACT|nr:hypothetical protein [Reichenbachiella agarivorans]UXP31696.1 hypothetical protein N6H18_15205 [Reichenbachiella agarivorans]